MQRIISLRQGLFLTIYIALKPLYLTRSGNMQIADIFLAIFSVYLLFSNYGKIRLRTPLFGFTVIFTVICAYQAVVNLVWSGIVGKSLMNFSLFYFFNLVACVDVFLIGQQIGLKKLKESLILGIFFALVVNSIGMLSDAVYRSRSVSFFNNPNQLGYFALICFSFIIFCSKQASKFVTYSIYTMAGWAVIASSSKAAIVALFIMVFIYMLVAADKSSTSKFALYIVSLLLIGIIVYLLLYSDIESIKNNKSVALMRDRIFNMQGENDSDLGDGRGYNRIAELGYDFLWGMGEGAYKRFESLSGGEIHSTYASLLVSYGVIGAAGYALLLTVCMVDKRAFFRNVAILSGPLMYQITHNGIRNPLVWMLLASMLYVKVITSDIPEYELIMERADSDQPRCILLR